MTRPRLLDLFCGAGGAAAGYHAAGFDVVGVDIVRQPDYPYTFHRGDALDYLRKHGHEFDAVHASPPCQAHSSLRHMAGYDRDPMLFPFATHVDLIPAARAALVECGRPYVIENVVGAPLTSPLLLCGSMFDLGATCVDGVYRQLRRHRLFESSVTLTPPAGCVHLGQPVGVYGNGGGGVGAARRGYKATLAEGRTAMGIDWTGVARLSQAIPPAYTRHIGAALLDHIGRRAAAA